jgi:hypothetical protein
LRGEKDNVSDVSCTLHHHPKPFLTTPDSSEHWTGSNTNMANLERKQKWPQPSKVLATQIPSPGSFVFSFSPLIPLISQKRLFGDLKLMDYLIINLFFFLKNSVSVMCSVVIGSKWHAKSISTKDQYKYVTCKSISHIQVLVT